MPVIQHIFKPTEVLTPIVPVRHGGAQIERPKMICIGSFGSNSESRRTGMDSFIDHLLSKCDIENSCDKPHSCGKDLQRPEIVVASIFHNAQLLVRPSMCVHYQSRVFALNHRVRIAMIHVNRRLARRNLIDRLQFGNIKA